MEDPRLTRLSQICAALPEAERLIHEPHAQFKIGTRTFAYFLSDHHGDGIVAVSAKGPHALIDAHPDRYYLPSYLGPKGWVALRLDRPTIDWDEVEDLVTGSYAAVAPKRLAAQLHSRGDTFG